MTSSIIGIISGLLVILTVALLKRLDKPTTYALILSGIGFLYVGYAWTDQESLIVNCLQAVFFLFIAYFGVKNNIALLIAGYFLHGIWDLLYHLFLSPNLIPPHYDLFCSCLDFTIGFYLIVLTYYTSKKQLPQHAENIHNKLYELKNEG